VWVKSLLENRVQRKSVWLSYLSLHVTHQIWNYVPAVPVIVFVVCYRHFRPACQSHIDIWRWDWYTVKERQ